MTLRKTYSFEESDDTDNENLDDIIYDDNHLSSGSIKRLTL